LQNIYDPGVLAAHTRFLLSVYLNQGVYIRRMRHKDRSYNSYHQSFSRLDHFPSALKLVSTTCILQDVPRLLCSDVFKSGEQSIGNHRTAVREALAAPFRCEGDALFFGERSQLRVRWERDHRTQDSNCEVAGNIDHGTFREKQRCCHESRNAATVSAIQEQK